jgi:esterase/lipase superfamily enzyme
MSYGSCEVVVPKAHKVGSIGSSIFTRLLKGNDKLKIKRLVPLNGALHWEVVKQHFSGGLGSSPPTILIHGYKTTFEKSVLWAAQIGFDLGLMRGVSLFSWPSQGQLNAYAADESAVESSKYQLADFLLEYAKYTGDSRPNVIAHSMGCRLLLGALEVIGLREPERLKVLNHIIFAAADVDQDAMRNAGAFVVGNSGRTSSYVAGDDLPLSATGWLHQFARVGLLPPVFLLEHLDTIEVQKTNLLQLGHGYVSGARNVLSDIFSTIHQSLPPEKRFAVEPVQAAHSHWRLKN